MSDIVSYYILTSGIRDKLKPKYIKKKIKELWIKFKSQSFTVKLATSVGITVSTAFVVIQVMKSLGYVDPVNNKKGIGAAVQFKEEFINDPEQEEGDEKINKNIPKMIVAKATCNVIDMVKDIGDTVIEKDEELHNYPFIFKNIKNIEMSKLSSSQHGLESIDKEELKELGRDGEVHFIIVIRNTSQSSKSKDFFYNQLQNMSGDRTENLKNILKDLPKHKIDPPVILSFIFTR
jgi:hypothetical protein